MAKDIIYFVINEGEVIYASRDEDEANDYCSMLEDQAYKEAKDALGLEDDCSENDLCDIGWKSGYDDGIFEVLSVDYNELKEKNDMTISGTEDYEITYYDILIALQKSYEYEADDDIDDESYDEDYDDDIDDDELEDDED